jgi:hypothetical protein
MRDPRDVVEVIKGATYEVPVYEVTDMGIRDVGWQGIPLCKGNKEDVSSFRQSGFFSESLIEVVRQYLVTVNVGDMATRETSMVITKLDEALMWMEKRSNDRKRRGVIATYNK